MNNSLRYFELPAGTLAVFKTRKPLLKRLWNCLTGKSTDRFNYEYKIMMNDTIFVTFIEHRWEFYTPRREYSKKEKSILCTLYPDTIEDIVATINSIRPNTLNTNILTVDSLRTNGYYKRVNGVEQD